MKVLLNPGFVLDTCCFFVRSASVNSGEYQSQFRTSAVKAFSYSSTLLQTLALFATVKPGYHAVETFSDTVVRLVLNYSVFGEDALVNVSVEKKDDNDGKLAGYIRIRSKTQGIALSLGDRITSVQRGLPEQNKQ